MSPRILCYDIETLPLIAATWGTRKQFIQHDCIIRPQIIVCASWMVIGEDRTPKSASILDGGKLKTVYDDEVVVRAIHAAMENADIWLGQNSDRYDQRHVNARARLYGLPPLPKTEAIDTLKQARAAYNLPSFKLDYMTRFFLGEKKLETGGQKLWNDIIQHDYPPVGEERDVDKAVRAIRKMVKYNKQDVKLTAKLYEHTRADFKRHPNRRLYGDADCPTCGSKKFKKDGHAYYGMGKYARFRCNDCGRRWVHSRAVERVQEKLA